MDVRRIGSIKQGDQIIGNRTKIKIAKNKVASPFKIAEFDIMYGLGVSREGSVLDCGVTAGLIKKSGSWYSYGDERIGQGRENSKQYLTDNPEKFLEIEKKVREFYGLTNQPPTEESQKSTKKE